jgi:hypothetical protein
MVPILIMLLSIGSLFRFAFCYWRGILAGAASQPVSESVLLAAQLSNGRITGQHFDRLATLYSLTPEGRGGLDLLRLYHRLVQAIGYIAGSRIPELASSMEREKEICASYLAVQIDRQLQSVPSL